MFRSFRDQMQRKITLNYPPKSVISLVPSQTELLFDLGLDEEIAGITKFCVHPASQFRKKTKVGGTKKIHFERIDALKPDLIIANKEENEKAQIERLAERYSVWVSDVTTTDDAIQMILKVGELVGKTEAAVDLANGIRQSFEQLEGDPDRRIRSAAYFIWLRPFMVAGKNTFIDSMMRLAGLENVFGNWSRYPALETEELRKHSPEVVLLSSEPFPFREKHTKEFRAIWPQAEIRLVDGTYFSWYGSRLVHAAAYLRKLFSENL